MILLVDANVLIDFVTTEPEVLSLVVTHLGSVHVPRDVLLEVEQLEESTCGALGLEVVDGTLDQLAEAATGGGRLSYADRVCLILARDHGWTCVTNDGRLRRECETTGIAVLWGLQLLLELVATGALEGSRAISVAEAIVQANPRMKPAVLVEFTRKVRAL